MEERIIVKSELSEKRLSMKKRIQMCCGGAIGVGLLILIIDYASMGGGNAATYVGIMMMALGIIAFIVLAIFDSFYSKVSMTVTDKRVYGVASFGRRVDLPIDSISAVGYTGTFNGIAVASSSGKIAFPFIKNAEEIYSAISSALVKRQSGSKIDAAEIKMDKYDELIKLKSLLDSGVITQEEFEAKKKELLN